MEDRYRLRLNVRKRSAYLKY